MSANFGCKNYQHPSPSELLLASTSPHKAFLSNTKHRDTGETLKIDTYPWKSAYKQQLVVVASGRSLQEPVIIVPAQRGGTELKIWKGEKSNIDDDDVVVPCPIYKEFDRGGFSGLAGMRLQSYPHSWLLTDFQLNR
jgi:hypothetical protein